MISLETIRQLKSLAANIKGTFNNPPYTSEDFLAIYPQFTKVIPANVIDFYISMANASLSYDIYRDQWVYAMGLYVGHFLTQLQKSYRIVWHKVYWLANQLEACL